MHVSFFTTKYRLNSPVMASSAFHKGNNIPDIKWETHTVTSPTNVKVALSCTDNLGSPNVVTKTSPPLSSSRMAMCLLIFIFTCGTTLTKVTILARPASYLRSGSLHRQGNYPISLRHLSPHVMEYRAPQGISRPWHAGVSLL